MATSSKNLYAQQINDELYAVRRFIHVEDQPGYQMLQYSYRLTGLWMYLAIQGKSDQFLAEAVAT